MRDPGMGETRDSIVADLETLRLHGMAGAWADLVEQRTTASCVNAGQEPLLCDGEASFLCLARFRAMAC